jgi:hypothetical protein
MEGRAPFHGGGHIGGGHVSTLTQEGPAALERTPYNSIKEMALG